MRPLFCVAVLLCLAIFTKSVSAQSAVEVVSVGCRVESGRVELFDEGQWKLVRHFQGQAQQIVSHSCRRVQHKNNKFFYFQYVTLDVGVSSESLARVLEVVRESGRGQFHVVRSDRQEQVIFQGETKDLPLRGQTSVKFLETPKGRLKIQIESKTGKTTDLVTAYFDTEANWFVDEL